MSFNKKRPLIAEIHVRVEARSWPNAQTQLKQILNDEQSKYGVLPLYMTSDVEDPEIRICLKFSDPTLLEAFIVMEIRNKLEGILGTRVRLTLDGEIFASGVAQLVSLERDIKSCHVFLSIVAGKDEVTWEALRQLPLEDGIIPTWLFRDFYEYDRDVTVRLVGGSKESFRSYIERHIGKIDGIRCWRLQFIDTMTHIASKELLNSLANQWVGVREGVSPEGAK